MNAPWLAPVLLLTSALGAAQPLRIEVFVPLCDRALIACGRPSAGDPQSLEANLYWGARYGAERYLSRAPRFTVRTRKDAPDPARLYLLREVVLRRAPTAGEREVEVVLWGLRG